MSLHARSFNEVWLDILHSDNLVEISTKLSYDNARCYKFHLSSYDSSFILLSLNPHSLHLYIIELPTSLSNSISPPQHVQFLTIIIVNNAPISLL
jgi:hypothetical protein